MSTSLSDIPGVWRRFLIGLAFARNYSIEYIDLPGPPSRNPILEEILPSLLHIKAVAIFDHALRALIDAKQMTLPKNPYRNDLRGRIDFLADNNILTDRVALHKLRDIRNDLAHEPYGVVDWNELDRDIASIHSVLRNLTLVGEIPRFEVFSERSEVQESPDPKITSCFHYRIAIKETNHIVAEITWSESLSNDDG
jgi:hypothetical protein